MRASHRRIAPALAPLAACALVALSASEARAAEGLELFPDPPVLALLLLLFAVLVAPVNALLFRPIFRVIDARSEKIDGTHQRAARLTAETEEVLKRYEQSVRAVREESEVERQRSLAEARQRNAAETARARADAERQIQQARSEITSELAGARTSLRAEAELLAHEAAARVLGRTLQ